MPLASQRFQCEHKLASLSPEQMFIAAEPIEREGGQRGEAEEAVADFRFDAAIEGIGGYEIVLLGLHQLQLLPIRTISELDKDPR